MSVKNIFGIKKDTGETLSISDLPESENGAKCNCECPFCHADFIARKLGRKNWMHCNTANGAKASAVLYSIAATAQANGIDTEQYLTELFSHPAGIIKLPFEI